MTVAPYGSWKSPITSDVIVEGTVGLGQIAVDGGDVYWSETRPTEGGRSVVVRREADGRTEDVTPPPFNARNRVHEYGGGAFTVADGIVYFSNFADQRLYACRSASGPAPLTPEADRRYGDGVVDGRLGRIICVMEDHTAHDREAANTLAAIPLSGGEAQVLTSGRDFYSSPRLNPDASRLAWLSWSHPNMPWDGCELWVADLAGDGSLAGPQRVAGAAAESIFQPEWSPDGTLYFVSDRTGWWNLYRWTGGRIEPLCDMHAEFGMPQWVLGMSTYGFESADRIICTYHGANGWRLASVDTASSRLEDIDTPFSSISSLRCTSSGALFVGGSATESASLVSLDTSAGQVTVLRRSSRASVEPGYISEPEAIEFRTEDGLSARAFFYPPRNRDYEGPSGERPPLLVVSHGGPTGSTSSRLSLSVQYWTSRGFAVLDVNYGGSTGYGRAYRERLNGKWGIVDVDDCVNGALYLVDRGDVDRRRLAIKGGSAGGYTTLSALTFRDVFKAGASYYGIGDLEAMAKDTHKFESRYLDGLVAPYPEGREIYKARSPIYFTDRLSCPVILFQGLEDRIVPPNQAESMVAALRAKGLGVAYVPFEGEQHGFRRSENIKRSLDAELYFYSRVFGFELADPIEPVPIENL